MTKKSKPQILPRKSPRQTRSKTLIESVLEATTRILTSMGYEKVTTNRVAELAGVSIGSLYQYFPNKDSIFAGLIQRHLEENKRRVIQIISENADQPAEVAIELIIRHIVQLFLDKRVLLKSLFLQLPRLEKTRELLHSRNEVLNVVADFLASHQDSLAVTDIKGALFVLGSSIMGVIQTVVLADEMPLSQEALTDELTNLTRRYLFKKQKS